MEHREVLIGKNQYGEERGKLQSAAFMCMCVGVCIVGGGCICRVNTQDSVFISAFSKTDVLIEDISSKRSYVFKYNI